MEQRHPALGPPSPVVPGHDLVRVTGRTPTSTRYDALDADSGRSESLTLTDPARVPADHVLALAAREEAIQQRVTSEHVLRLREVVPLATGAVALVRDPAEGGSLEDLVGRRGRLDLAEAVTVLTPLATTVAELAAADIVHGDLRPGHVLFTPEGKPMLTGYDAARMVGEGHPAAVDPAPGFVAPELRTGGIPTPQSDVWALGALAWYALTGGEAPPSDAPDRAADTLGAEVGAVVGAMLADDPETRVTARIGASRIYRLASPTPVRLAREAAPAASLRPAPPSTFPVPSPRPMTRREASAARVPEKSSRGPGSMPLRLVVGLLGFVAFVTVFLVLLARLGPDTGATAGPARPATTGSATPVSGPTSGARATTSSTSPAVPTTPTEILQSLYDARARALVARDPSLLAACEVVGGEIHDRDVATIEQLRQRGLTYASLTFHVRDVGVVQHDDGVLVVDAVVARDADVVLGPGGSRSTQVAETGSLLRYGLTRTAQGWRLATVRSVT